jgi:hypothetical protein
MHPRAALTPDEIQRVLVGRPTALTGAAGEYFVAAELSLRGWLATVTIKNAPGTDVLAQNLVSGAVVAIQTKTASHGNRHFQLGEKSEAPATAQNQWYVFVMLNKERMRPRFFVVPRNVVAAAMYAEHREWLSRTARDGTPHRENPRRNMQLAYITGYEDRWDLLERPADEAPLLIDQWYTDCVKKFGLPSNHPGWPSA